MRTAVILYVHAVIIYMTAILFWKEPKVIYKTVNTPPTDQQLIAFWFGGNQKQTELRKRICK